MSHGTPAGQGKRGLTDDSTATNKGAGRDSGVGGGQKSRGLHGDSGTGNGLSRSGRPLPKSSQKRGVTTGADAPGSSEVKDMTGDTISTISEGY
jgi:hypothetical protein